MSSYSYHAFTLRSVTSVQSVTSIKSISLKSTAIDSNHLLPAAHRPSLGRCLNSHSFTTLSDSPAPSPRPGVFSFPGRNSKSFSTSPSLGNETRASPYRAAPFLLAFLRNLSLHLRTRFTTVSSYSATRARSEPTIRLSETTFCTRRQPYPPRSSFLGRVSVPTFESSFRLQIPNPDFTHRLLLERPEKLDIASPFQQHGMETYRW